MIRSASSSIGAPFDRFLCTAAICAVILTACAALIRPIEAAAAPVASVLETTIFVQGDDRPTFRYVEFHVPVAGEATLRVVNAAKLGAAFPQRMRGAEVRLNDLRVVSTRTFNKLVNVLEVPVVLEQGTNRLGVRLRALPGKRLSVRIDAFADAIALEPVRNAVVAGTERVRAQATVTALNLPVAGATVKFALERLGEVPAVSVSTDGSGEAQASVGPIANTGPGELTATLAGSDPLLGATTAIEVVMQAPLTVEHRPPTLRLATGASRGVSVEVDVREVEGSDNRVTLRHVVVPEAGGDVAGVTVTSDFAGKALDAPASFPVPITVTGVTPGPYRILSTATNEKTGASATGELTVRVFTPETLILSTPTLQPAGIPIATTSPVIIQSRASGVTAFPAALDVQQCAPAASACGPDPSDPGWTLIGTLFDNGEAIDSFAGNGVYSGTLDLFGGEEGQLLYRVTAGHRGAAVVSGARVLQVTRFVVGADPRPPESLEDPVSGVRFAAEQVLVSFLSTTTPERVEAIIAEAIGEVTDQTGRVIGYLPEIGLYQVAWSVAAGLTPPERAALVNAAVDEFNRFEAVRYATPNGIGEFAAESDGSAVDSGRGRWGALRSRAGDAWDASGKSDYGDVAFKVAVLEEGVFANHSELGIIDPSGDTDPRSDSHGTSVAGVIAASLDSSTSGMSGIAPGVPIKRVATECNGGQLDDAVLTAKNDLDVKIINITCAMIPSNTSNPFPDLDSAIQQATTRPASAGGPTLVVASAGNYGDDVDSPTKPYYPCKFNNVFCVGNTTLANPTNLSSADKLHDASQTWGHNHDGTAHDCGSNLSSIPGFTYGPSNYGSSVDIYAPGTCIYTTKRGGGYHWVTGTSFAAPHVAGAAAVVWEKLKTEQGLGNVTAAEVRQVLLDAADPFTDTVGGVAVSGKRLNLLSAIEAVGPVTLADGGALVTIPTTGELILISGTSNTVINTIDIGGQPGDIAVDVIARRAYVADSDTGRLSIVDLTTNLITDTISLAPGIDEIAVVPEIGIALISNPTSNALTCVDLDSSAVLGTQNLGEFGPAEAIAVSPSRAEVYFISSDISDLTDFPPVFGLDIATLVSSNCTFSGDLGLLIRVTTLVDSGGDPGSPLALTVSATDDFIFVATTSGEEFVIDLASFDTVASVGTGTTPIAVASAPGLDSDFYYVLGRGSGAFPPLGLIEKFVGTLAGNPTIFTEDVFPLGVTADSNAVDLAPVPETRTIYAATFGGTRGNSVVRYDHESNATVASIPLGGQPAAIAFIQGIVPSAQTPSIPTNFVVQGDNGSVLLSWDPPTTNTDGSVLADLAGYRIDYGNSNGGPYTTTVDVDNPGLTSYTVENLQPGTTYYFVISALNTGRVASGHSQEASWTNP